MHRNMRTFRVITMLLSLFALAGFIAGCGDSDKDKKSAANALADANGNVKGVTVDPKTGQVTAKGKDGQIYSNSNEPPEGWPSELKPPSGSTISSSTTMGTNMIVGGSTKQTVEAFAASMASQLASAGWGKGAAADTGNTSNMSLTSFTKGDKTAQIQVSGVAGQEASFSITYSSQQGSGVSVSPNAAQPQVTKEQEAQGKAIQAEIQARTQNQPQGQAQTQQGG